MRMPLIMCSCDPGGAAHQHRYRHRNAPGHLAGDDRLRPLIAAWLLSFKSPHTVRNYRTDLAHWLAFCAEHGVDPLSARRAQAYLRNTNVAREARSASWSFADS